MQPPEYRWHKKISKEPCENQTKIKICWMAHLYSVLIIYFNKFWVKYKKSMLEGGKKLIWAFIVVFILSLFCFWLCNVKRHIFVMTYLWWQWCNTCTTGFDHSTIKRNTKLTAIAFVRIIKLNRKLSLIIFIVTLNY